MPTLTRYLTDQVVADLARRMVFVAGARQVGKTTFARSLPGAAGGYLNWDVPADRQRILSGTLPVGTFWISSASSASTTSAALSYSRYACRSSSARRCPSTVFVRIWKSATRR